YKTINISLTIHPIHLKIGTYIDPIKGFQISPESHKTNYRMLRKNNLNKGLIYIKMIKQKSSREQIICVLYSIERHLVKIKRKAIEAGYPDNTMIVSGVENILKMCEYNHHSSSENHIYSTIRLILYILPKRNS